MSRPRSDGVPDEGVAVVWAGFMRRTRLLGSQRCGVKILLIRGTECRGYTSIETALGLRRKCGFNPDRGVDFQIGLETDDKTRCKFG